MVSPPAFNTTEQAHTTIKQQILSLCNTYTDALFVLQKTLKKAIEHPRHSQNTGIQTAILECTDHLHNLNQLHVEVSNTKNSKETIIIEVSAEVLANTFKFLNNVPEQLNL
jgi:hypothetical protein